MIPNKELAEFLIFNDQTIAHYSNESTKFGSHNAQIYWWGRHHMWNDQCRMRTPEYLHRMSRYNQEFEAMLRGFFFDPEDGISKIFESFKAQYNASNFKNIFGVKSIRSLNIRKIASDVECSKEFSSWIKQKKLKKEEDFENLKKAQEAIQKKWLKDD